MQSPQARIVVTRNGNGSGGSGQQRPAAASSGQQRPAAASSGQQRPAAAVSYLGSSLLEVPNADGESAVFFWVGSG